MMLLVILILGTAMVASVIPIDAAFAAIARAGNFRVNRGTGTFSTTAGTNTRKFSGRGGSVATCLYADEGGGDPPMMEDEELEELRNVAAKAREDADRLAQIVAAEMPPQKKKLVVARGPTKFLTAEEVKEKVANIDWTNDMSSQLDALVESGDFTLWKRGRLGPGTKPSNVTAEELFERSYGLLAPDRMGMETRDEGKLRMQTLCIASVCAIGGALAYRLVPEDYSTIVPYLYGALAAVPLLYFGNEKVTIFDPVPLPQGTMEEQRRDVRLAVACRTAANFMVGYIYGLPIRRLGLMKVLEIPVVKFFTSERDGGTMRESYGLGDDDDDGETAAVLVVLMSGVVGEILGCVVFAEDEEEASMARAGLASSDLRALRHVFLRTESLSEENASKERQMAMRWAALQAFDLLTGNLVKFQTLVVAFLDQKPFSEWIAILESDPLKGEDGDPSPPTRAK